MPRIAYVNGRYLPHGDARVHIEDRGYQLADGVYEVVGILDGRPIDLGPHLDRLERSLAGLRIRPPMARKALCAVLAEVARRNGVGEGIVYLQVTRGVYKRDHAFPPPAVRPALTVTARSQRLARDDLFAKGVKVVSVPDLRWARCDLKTINLLANLMGKQEAKEKGAFEAWMVDGEGRVTEGTSSNACIVTGGGEIVTHPAGPPILSGITRARVLSVARQQGMTVVERPFSLEEAKAAAEAFLTSTTSFVLPVVSIDGARIGTGQPGKCARRLRAAYIASLDGMGWR